MNRQILVGMVGLALAGCAQTHPIMPQTPNTARLPPVGLTPVPNIYEAVTSDNARIDPSAVHPERGPVLANMGAAPGGPGPAGPVPCMACANTPVGSASLPAPAVAAGPQPPTAATASAVPAMAASAPAGAGNADPSPVAGPAPVSGFDAGPTAGPLPAPAPPPGGDAIEQTGGMPGATAPEARPESGDAPDPATPAAPEMPAPPPATTSPDPGPAPATAPEAATTPNAEAGPAAPATATAPSSPLELPPAEPAPGGAAPAPVPSEPSAAASPEPAPLPEPEPKGAAAAPPSEPSPGAAATPVDLPGATPIPAPATPGEMPAGAGASAASMPADLPPLPPATSGEPSAAGPAASPTPSPAPATLPSLESAPATGPAPSPAAVGPGAAIVPAPASTSDPTASASAPAPDAAPGASARPTETARAEAGAVAKSDPNVVTTAADPAAIHAEGQPINLKEAGRAAARIGDEVITYHALTVAVKEKIAQMPSDYKPTRQDIMMITSRVLDNLIERSIIAQEAKREMKKPEQIKQFMSIAEKVWREEEIPPLLRKFNVSNEYQLKEALASRGQSLDTMRETFKTDFMAQGFLHHKVGGKLMVTLSEMRDYYQEHWHDFDRPEQWTWREAVVEVGRHPGRAEARKKAEAILDRLRRGDDFAKVAREASEGPNRKDGGLWQTAPGSYAVEGVNQALRALPPGQVSAILEGPTSYHIVRVESRRPAGPASFHEVQDEIRRAVRNNKAKAESEAFIDKLRRETIVSTIFDNTAYAPTLSREPDPAPPGSR